MDYEKYHENKPHYAKMVVWRIINNTLFIMLPRVLRHMLLRVFGAKIGRRCKVYPTSKIYAPWNLQMADGVVVGPRVEIYNKANVQIGKQAIISQDAYLCTASHDINSKSMAIVLKPIIISNKAWIAAHAIILPGVSIGEGAVIAAGAVVSNTISKWVVVGGNPARVIKKRVLTNE